MKKITFLFLAIVAMIFSATKVSAQMPVASTADEPVWYYIECGHNSDDGHIIADKDGRYAQLITSRETGNVYMDAKLPLVQKDAQLWRLEELDYEDNIYYYLVNKVGGYLAVDATAEGYSASNASRYYLETNEDEAIDRFYTISLIGSAADENKGGIFCTIKDEYGFKASDFILTGLNNGYGFHLSNSAPYGGPVGVKNEKGLVSNPRAWRFVPEAELDEIFPTMVATDETIGNTEGWYNIKNNLSGEYLYTTEEGTLSFAESVDTEDLANYVFRLVQNKTVKNSFVNFMNGNGVTVNLDAQTNFMLRYAFTPIDGTESAQFYFSSGDDRVGKQISAEGLVTFDSKVEIYDTNKTWSFEEAEFTYVPNSVGSVNLDNVRVFVENGYVVVSGTDISPEIYTATGASVSANARLASGVYLVKVADKVEKVIVK